MQADIVRLDTSRRLRSLTGYSLGLALYVFVVVALYPAFKHSNSLDSLVRNDATAAALFGITGRISSSGGWLNANVYANFFPLIMLLLTVGYGAASVAGQDEDGTLCLVVALPVRRSSIVLQKVGAMVMQGVVLAVVVAAFVFIGRSFGLSVTGVHIVSVSGAVLLMGLDFGILAMVVGALSGRRSTALGVATALAAASYLVSSLAPVASWLRPARAASLFYWSVANNQITAGVTLEDVAVLTVTAAVGVCSALLAFDRLDVR